MKFILGKKLEMSQKFIDDKFVPVTIIGAGPCLVAQIKTKDIDGYEAVQISYGKAKKLNKPLSGHLKKTKNNEEINKNLREFRTADSDLNVGDIIKVDVFKKGDAVNISGNSKGRGFQGVVKRWGFHGADASHGTKDQERMPGSSGPTGPAKVFKGKKMPGRMGGKRASIKNLEIIEVDSKKNLLFVKGAVPGARNSLLEVRSVSA